MSKPRSIFEEVSGDAAKPIAQTGGIERGGAGGGNRSWVRIWLMMLFVLVAAMVVVGGLTRLTDSGLSITEWAPFTGAMPPLNDADWALEFGKSSKSPNSSCRTKAWIWPPLKAFTGGNGGIVSWGALLASSGRLAF